MSMLGRYQKKGGFVQLLNLIETCGPEKQGKFLKMIEDEDSRWAEAIRKKMISFKTIIGWSDEIVAEILSRVHELTLATALFGMTEEETNKALKTFSASQKRRITDLKASKVATPAEISAAMFRIVQDFRGMVKDGYCRLDKIDASLIIEDDIEEKIAQSFSDLAPDMEAPNIIKFETDHQPTSDPQPAVKNQEMEFYKQKVSALAAENQKLKLEVKTLRDKLDQIRKAAA